MKKSISIFLAIVMSFTLLTPVFATSSPETNTSSDNTIISFEQYYEAVRAEYAKYGIGYEVIERNDDFIFTEKVLNDKLEEIRNTLENTDVTYNADYDPYPDTQEDKPTVANNSPVVTSMMPVDRVYQHISLVNSPAAPTLAWANICMEVVAQVDAQSDDLMGIISYSSFQKGSYMNFISWTQRSMTVSPNYMKDYFTATVNGLLNVQYTEPTTGLLVGNTSEHTFSHTFYVK